jgi:hypothetical protein
MTDASGDYEDSHVRRKHLPVSKARDALRDTRGGAPLARHPDDGFVLADPYAVGSTTRRALRALISVLIPPAPAPTAPDMVDRIELCLRRFMAYMPPLSAKALVLCIWLLDLAPLYLFKGVSRLYSLPKQRASRLLSEMVHGRYAFLRTLVVAIRGLVLSAYFDQDEVHKALGYAPIPFIRERIQRRQLLLKPALAHAGGAK